MPDWVTVALAVVAVLMGLALGYVMGLDAGTKRGFKDGFGYGRREGLYEARERCGVCDRKDAGCVPDPAHPGHWLCKGHMPRSARTHVAFDEKGKG